MSIDFINYDQLTQDAMRIVIKNILKNVSQNGLPGNHFFYISFNTKFLGVSISKSMYKKYPEEMTIIIQHQFWDLKIKDEILYISLNFNNILEKIKIPLVSIKSFFDPYVQFKIQFKLSTKNHKKNKDLKNNNKFNNIKFINLNYQKNKDLKNNNKSIEKKHIAKIINLNDFRKNN